MIITEKNKRLNISLDNKSDDIEVYKDLYGTHVRIDDMTYGGMPELVKVEDYLYEITVDDVDEDYPNQVLSNPFGACSEIRNEEFIGRNYDWTYSNNCEFIVRTLAKPSRHASIGVSSVSVTETEIASNNYNEKLKLIPHQLLDGVNDCGVYCGINVVPTGDKGLTKGTHPGKKKLPNISIPRFVLDRASTAKEAVKLLDTRDIYSIIYDGEQIELHALIADAEDTFIIEFVNNKLVATSYDDKKAIMTNFYVTDWNGIIAAKWLGNTDEEIKATGLTPHAEGLERYLILQNGLSSVSSLDSTKSLMEQVKFTKAYDKSMNPFWYSELVGARGLTIYNTPEEYEEVVDIFIDMYEHRDRAASKTWQTVHTSCYDIKNKEFIVVVQEGSNVHNYSLDVNTSAGKKYKTLSELKKKI